jgi:hypothetical protein
VLQAPVRRQERTDQLQRQVLLGLGPALVLLERRVPEQRERMGQLQRQELLEPGRALVLERRVPGQQEQMDPLRQQVLERERLAFLERTDHRPDQPLAFRC